MLNIHRTISTILILPLLDISKDDLKSNNFLNAYVTDSRRDVQYEDSIYLVFKPDNVERFREFLEFEYERTACLIDDYDYEDGFVVLVYKLPSLFDKDIGLVKQGKYSQTSEKFQKKFPKVIKRMVNGKQRDELSLQIRIFKKSPELKDYWETKIGEPIPDDMEVWPKWEDHKESLELEQLKKELYEDA